MAHPLALSSSGGDSAGDGEPGSVTSSSRNSRSSNISTSLEQDEAQVSRSGTGQYIFVTMNRSCEFCHKRKRRCDGNGINCCSLCIEKGQQCVYGKRRPYTARRSTGSRPRSSSGPGGAASSMSSAVSVEGLWEFGNTETGKYLQSLVGPNGNISPAKRCKLSPSLACGLVGLLENTLLSDYFRCWGLIPWTSPRTVRRAMVMIMLPPTPQQRPGSSSGRDSDAPREITDSTHVSSAASTCMFWSAVALGGLAQGRPMTTLEGYIQRADDSLTLCANGETEEVARAYAMMSKLHYYTGKSVSAHICSTTSTVRELQSLSKGSGLVPCRMYLYSQTLKPAAEYLIPPCLPTVIHNVSEIFAYSQVLAYIAHRPAVLKFGHVSEFEPAQLKAFGNGTHPPCQMSRIVTEDEICRYLVGCEIDLSQAIAADVGSDGGHDTRGRDEPAWEQAKAEIGLPSESGQVDPCYVEESPAELTQGVQPMSAMLGYLLEAAPHFRRLQEIVDNLMAIAKAANNDGEGAIESVKKCVELVSRYPGVCLAMGVHVVHCALTALAAVEDRETYEKLRTVYEQVRPADETPLPPMEERLGAGDFCDALLCRAMQRVIESGKFGFSPSAFLQRRATHSVSECHQHDDREPVAPLSRDVLVCVLGELDGLEVSQPPHSLQQGGSEPSNGVAVPLHGSTVVVKEMHAAAADSSNDLEAGLTAGSAAFSTQVTTASAIGAEQDISSGIVSETACQTFWDSTASGSPAAETSGALGLYSLMELDAMEDAAAQEDWLDVTNAILVEAGAEAGTAVESPS